MSSGSQTLRRKLCQNVKSALVLVQGTIAESQPNQLIAVDFQGMSNIKAHLWIRLRYSACAHNPFYDDPAPNVSTNSSISIDCST